MCTDYEKLQAKMSATVLSHPGDITKTSLFSWTKYDIADSLFLGLLTWIKPTKHRCIFAGLPLNVVPFLTRSKGLAVGGAELNAEPAYQSKPYAGVMVALCFFFISSFSAPVDLIKHTSTIQTSRSSLHWGSSLHISDLLLQIWLYVHSVDLFTSKCNHFYFFFIFFRPEFITFVSCYPSIRLSKCSLIFCTFFFNIQDYCLYFKL